MQIADTYCYLTITICQYLSHTHTLESAAPQELD